MTPTSEPLEDIATITVRRDEVGRYVIGVALEGDTHAEISSGEWRTVRDALDFAARVIAGVLHKRKVKPEVVGDPEVP